MKIQFQKVEASLAGLFTKKPSITTFTRLETQPTAVGLLTGLQAPVADPLWMLARQWQFNEFQGEDAGTPLQVGFAVEGLPITAFRPGKADQPWLPLAAGQAPIETQVEAEAIWATHARLRGEAGLQLLRMTPTPTIRAALLQAYALALPTPSDPEADQVGLLWSSVLHQRTVDAAQLLSDLTPLRDGAGELTGLPATLSLTPADAATAQTLLNDWLRAMDDLLYERTTANPAWQDARLEYTFALGTGPLAAGASAVALNAEEYTDGHVDWHSFQAQALAAPQQQPLNQQFVVPQRHPTPVRYPGMPAERYWEFEDGAVNFAGAEAGITDLLRMSVTEFALTFGNDWFLVPVRLPVGALYRVSHLEVVDSFGIHTTAGPVQNLGQTPWDLFEMSADASLGTLLRHTIFLPDSLNGVMEGPPLEHTLLVRDEMANLAWAIEKKVQGASGDPLDRELEAKGLAFLQQLKFDEPPSPQVVYRLATPVPANWTPLLPVRKPGLNATDPLEIQLERAGMKRFYPGPETLGAPDASYEHFLDGLDTQEAFISKVPIAEDAHIRVYVFYPRGWLLRRDPTQPMPDDDRLLIEEEEVPRIGASLKRKFQYARTADGKSWLWIGRSKLSGRGEAASGLRFDVAQKQRP